MPPSNAPLSVRMNCWDFAALALRDNRFDLIEKFNIAMAPPSPAVQRLQQEFIDGTMDTEETLAFAKVYFDLVNALDAETLNRR